MWKGISMAKAYYINKIKKFILETKDSILGQLHINDEFETTDFQHNAWKEEIKI